MPSSPTELIALLAGIRENPKDLARWLVTSDALREEGHDQLADCFEHVGRDAFAHIIGVFRSIAEIRKPVSELLVRCNQRAERKVGIEKTMKHIRTRMRTEQNLLIDQCGKIPDGFSFPEWTAISGGIIALPGKYWLVVLYVDVIRMKKKYIHPPLPNRSPNRSSRCSRQRDGLSFVEQCLKARRPTA